jgi:protein-arginine kinase activator protein McsA
MQIGRTGISFGSAASDKVMDAYNQATKNYAETEGKTPDQLTEKEKAKAYLKLGPAIEEFKSTVEREKKENRDTTTMLRGEIERARKLVEGDPEQVQSADNIDRTLSHVYYMV